MHLHVMDQLVSPGVVLLFADLLKQQLLREGDDGTPTQAHQRRHRLR